MKIKEIVLNTDNLEETTEFYCKILGFEKLVSEKNTISLRAGLSILTFNLAVHSSAQYHFTFNIPGNKLEEAITWITQKKALIKISEDTSIADLFA